MNDLNYVSKNKKKILIFIPAYNVEKSILHVLKRIPENLFNEHFISILIIEDFSKDKTKYVIEEYIKKNSKNNSIHLIKNNFDYVIMLHGDGQYAPEKIPEFISNLLSSNADAVFGSRMINSKDALKGGMPMYKFIGNKVLTFIQNLILGSKISEFHSGYRSYKVEVLKKINFEKNTDYFHFDSEIIIQMLKLNYVIKEIPMATFYGNEVSHLRSIPYGINVLISTIKYKFFYNDWD